MTDDASAPHVDFDVIADSEAGLLPEAESASVRAHIASCADCQARAAQFAATMSQLHSMPAEPMPADVADRISAALAAAARPAGSTVVPISAARSVRNRLPMLGAVAASVAVLAAIVIGATSLGHSDKNRHNVDVTAAGPTLAQKLAQISSAEHVSGNVYATGSAGTQLEQLLKPTAAPAPEVQVPKPTASGKGTSGLENTRVVPSSGAGTAALVVPHALAALKASPAKVEACIGYLTHMTPAPTPVAIDFARLKGVGPVLVLVLPEPGSSTEDDAFFVSPPCSSAANAMVPLYTKVATTP